MMTMTEKHEEPDDDNLLKGTKQRVMSQGCGPGVLGGSRL